MKQIKYLARGISTTDEYEKAFTKYVTGSKKDERIGIIITKRRSKSYVEEVYVNYVDFIKLIN